MGVLGRTSCGRGANKLLVPAKRQPPTSAHHNPAATARALTWQLNHDDERRALGARGHAAASPITTGAVHADRFVALL